MRLPLFLLPLAALILGCASPLNGYRLALTTVATSYTVTAKGLGDDNARDLAVCNGPETPPAQSVACVLRVTDQWADRNKALKAAFLALKAAEDALDLATSIELAGGAVDLAAIANFTSQAVQAALALKALLAPLPAPSVDAVHPAPPAPAAPLPSIPGVS